MLDKTTILTLRGAIHAISNFATMLKVLLMNKYFERDLFLILMEIMGFEN